MWPVTSDRLDHTYRLDVTGLQEAKETCREIAAVVTAITSGQPLPPLAPQSPATTSPSGVALLFWLNLLLTAWLIWLTLPCAYSPAHCTAFEPRRFLPFLVAFFTVSLLNLYIGDLYRLFGKNRR